MKCFGASLAFHQQRTDSLVQGYRRLVSMTSHIELSDIASRLVELPAPRFWVSDKRAFDVISALRKGLPVLDRMRPTKRDMFLEIDRRTTALLERYPHLSLHDAVAEVVFSPAPRHYLTPKTAYEYILRARRQARK